MMRSIGGLSSSSAARVRAINAGLLSLLVVLLLGCGGSDRSPREEYLANADEVCSGANERFGKDLSFEGGGSFAVNDIAVLNDRIPVFKAVLRQIRALQAPTGDERLLKPWLSKMDEFVKRIEKLRDRFKPDVDPSGIDRNSLPGNYALDALTMSLHESGAEEAGKAARRVGLADCGKFKAWQIFPKKRSK